VDGALKLYISLPLAALAWLLITRVPVDGAAVLAVAAAWGAAYGFATRHWSAGPLAFAAAIVGDGLALLLGWFLFLTDFWIIPPLVGGLAGLISGVLAQGQPWRHRPL
jgi:hypothetical protein